jgi:acyl-CoA thioester hydrolase
MLGLTAPGMADAEQDQPAGGRFAGREHRFALRVYFEDTDLSGVVYHANYLRYMERARSDMLRVGGIDQRAAFEAGEGSYAIASLAIRYAAPARLDDALVIVSRITQVRAASVAIHQRVMCGGLVLAEADVVAALIAPNGRPRRQPRAWTDIYERLVWQGEA